MVNLYCICLLQKTEKNHMST